MKYNIFQWQDRNSGRIISEHKTKREARAEAKRTAGSHYTIQDSGGGFEEYENGERVSWSL